MTWNDLRAGEIEGKMFRTWSVSGKCRNVEFCLQSTDNTGMTFRKQNGKLQRLPRAAAENVLEHWERYKSGEVSRAELAVNNFSTSYLFGVLRSLDVPSNR